MAATAYDAGSPENYTIGGLRFYFAPVTTSTPWVLDDYIYLGNVVTGGFNSAINFLDHFTAKSGSRKKDRSLVQEVTLSVNLTLDEPNSGNMNRFMLGGTETIATGVSTFAPYTKLEILGGAVLVGVSSTGNEFKWAINRATLKPDGDFSFNDQDWSQFQFILEPLDDSTDNPTKPYGEVKHYGVGSNIYLTDPTAGPPT
jgi:hypothetical protein